MTREVIIRAADPFVDTDLGRRIPVYRPKPEPDFVVDTTEQELEFPTRRESGYFAAGMVAGALILALAVMGGA